MATAAERARKRDLGPDWREKLRDSLRLLAMRTIGAVLIGASVAQGVALLTHNSVDPSFSTAAGGPPVNWLGSVGAYSSDLLLMLFGPAAALFLPVIAIAGLRLMRGEPAGTARPVAARRDRSACCWSASRSACCAGRPCRACPPVGAACSAWPGRAGSTTALR